MKQIKSIFQVAVSNVINFGSSFVVGFLLPLVLSVNEYGKYKKFTLLFTFFYIFNFGYNDGIYIKYGGKNLQSISKNQIKREHNFVIYFQTIILFLMLLYSYFSKNVIFMWFAFVTFFANITTFHQNFFQAVGEFKLFSMSNIAKSSFFFLSLLVSIFYFKSENFHIYILMFLLSYIFVAFFCEFIFLKNWGISFKTSITDQIRTFQIGSVILLANWSLTFVGNAGNVVVKYGFSIEEFAIYSFQTSILNLIILIVNSVGMVFYNYISQNISDKILKITKFITLLLGIYSGILFFVFKIIIILFLPDYTDAIPLLSITMISVPYLMVSKILISNLYKTREKEKIYLRDTLILALISLLLAVILYISSKNIYLITLSTTISYILWYIYTTNIKFSLLKTSVKELIMLSSHLFVYVFSTMYLSNLMGLIIYLTYLILLTYTYKSELLYMGKLIFNK